MFRVLWLILLMTSSSYAFDINATLVNCSCTALSNDTTSPPSSDNSDLLRTLKIVLIVILGIGHLAFSMIPWGVDHLFHSKLKPILECCCCGAAGVILGAGFSHLLPDSINGFNGYFATDNPTYSHSDYPFASLVAVGMLMILLWLDKVVIDGLASSANVQPHGCCKVSAVDSSISLQVSNECDCAPVDTGVKTVGRAYVFFFALSIHGIFEGLALGAATTLDSFIGLLIAITAHKMLDGFSLGVPIYNAHFKWWHSLILLILCAAMTPLGIGIGWIITDAWSGGAALLAQGIVFGLTCGCFIYIALIAMIPPALSSGTLISVKLGLLTVGWGAMALIATWV